MTQILSVMHYIPDRWKGKAHTMTVRSFLVIPSIVKAFPTGKIIKNHQRGGVILLSIPQNITSRLVKNTLLHCCFLHLCRLGELRKLFKIE